MCDYWGVYCIYTWGIVNVSAKVYIFGAYVYILDMYIWRMNACIFGGISNILYAPTLQNTPQYTCTPTSQAYTPNMHAYSKNTLFGTGRSGILSVAVQPPHLA